MTYLDIYNIEGSGAKQSWDKLPLWGKTTIIGLFSLLVIYLLVAALTNSWTLGFGDCQVYKVHATIDYANQPEQAMPELNMPEQAMPEQAMPELNMPELNMPELNMPEQVMSEQVMPEQKDNIMAFSNMEPFTNDLPYQLNNESVTLSPDVDYNEVLQKMSLDKSVMEQHKQYVTDRNKITSTASFVPARSDTQDIVTTWGLTKPKYVQIDSSAREIPSQDPEQGSKPITLRWN